MASTNKTGLVLKIAIVLVLALGVILYKFNDFSRNDKTVAMQEQLRKVVLNIKTSVSGQLSQLKNNLSGYGPNISESNINWVQLDPFFAIANAQNNSGKLTVTQVVTRSNTPAERWNAAYLEGALKVNKSKKSDGIIIQLFKDKAGAKFILVRFPTGDKNEVVLASTADYFQKYFDIERGSRYKSLLITTEKILAGHTEGDYLATPSKEASLPPSKYVIESEEIVGTNLIAVSYVLKSKIVPPFAVPWSIVGLILGIGLVLIGLVYYNLDNIERRLERYKKQEREQIYKDTLQASRGEAVPDLSSLTTGSQAAGNSDRKQSAVESAEAVTEEITKTAVPLTAATSQNENARFEIQEPTEDEPDYLSPPQTEYSQPAAVDVSEDKPEPAIYDLLESDYKPEDRIRRRNEAAMNPRPERDEYNIEPAASEPGEADSVLPPAVSQDASFLTLDEESIDLDEIDKALALDDFDQEEKALNVRAEALEKNLQPQKVSLSPTGAPIEKPQFVFEKKDFKVDDIKVNVRRPERS